jgi:hypothetical protein
MKNSIFWGVIFSIVVCLTGCNKQYGRYHPDDTHAIESLAGGVVGALLAGNTGGAIVGALVIDAYSVPTVKYEVKKIEDRDEASRRLKQPIEKAEQPREIDKKAEQQREVDKKAEQQREVDKKAEQQREVDKKAENTREKQKRATKRRDEEQVRLFIGESELEDHIIRAGSPVEAKVQYTVLANQEVEGINITETRVLISGNKSFELDSREVYRTQGTYQTTVTFKIPNEISEGYCILYTIISNGKYRKTTKALFKII